MTPSFLSSTSRTIMDPENPDPPIAPREAEVPGDAESGRRRALSVPGPSGEYLNEENEEERSPGMASTGKFSDVHISPALAAPSSQSFNMNPVHLSAMGQSADSKDGVFKNNLAPIEMKGSSPRRSLDGASARLKKHGMILDKATTMRKFGYSKLNRRGRRDSAPSSDGGYTPKSEKRDSMASLPESFEGPDGEIGEQPTAAESSEHRESGSSSDTESDVSELELAGHIEIPDTGPTPWYKVALNFFVDCVHIIKSYIGVGVLALPFGFSKVGWFCGTVVLILVGIVSYYAILLLVWSKHRLKPEHPDCHSYGDIMFTVFGRFGALLTDALLVLTQYGFCCAYMVFVGQNMHKILGALPVWAWVFFTLPILIPISFLRNLRKLAIFSLVADVAVLLGISVVFYFVFGHITDGDNLIVMYPFQIPVFLGQAVYAYEGIGVMLPIESSMKKPEGFYKRLTVSMILVSGIFVTLGLCGYLAFGDETNSIVTLNLPPTGLSTFIQFSLVIAVLFTFPLMFFPVMEIAEKNRLFKRGVTHREAKRNVLRASLVLSCACVSLAIPDFGLFVGLIGAFGSSCLAFILPTAIHLKVFGKEAGKTIMITNIVIFVFGVFSGCLGTWMILSEIFEKYVLGVNPSGGLHGG